MQNQIVTIPATVVEKPILRVAAYCRVSSDSDDQIGTREVFVIYPAIDGDIVLRCLNTNKREYIRFPEFDEFVSYRFEQVSSGDS